MHISVVVVLTILATFGNAVGLNLQKWSMNKEESKPLDVKRRLPFLQPVWLVGMFLMALKALSDVILVGMAPITLLAPLGALSLGFNVILAPIFHPGERASCNVWMATGWIYVGVILTVLFAPSSDPVYDLELIMDLMLSPPFWGFVIFCLLFAGAIGLHGRRRGYGRLYYTGMAGCIGAWNIILAKANAEIVMNAIATKDFSDFKHPVPYVILILLVATVITTLTFLNKGLAKFEALIIIPVFVSFFTAFAITGSLIFYQEYKFMTNTDKIVYAAGIVVMMVGVTLLVRERAKEVIVDTEPEVLSTDLVEVDLEKGDSDQDGQVSVNRTEDDDDLEDVSEEADPANVEVELFDEEEKVPIEPLDQEDRA